jgi:hypothetical protein
MRGISFRWGGALLAAACYGLAMFGAIACDDKPPPDDGAISAFIVYLEKNGIKLEADERNWWVVTDPKGDGYEVVVSLKAFPAGTSEKAMRADLMQINLAYALNAPSGLAMSRPGLRGTEPDKELPKLDQVQVAAKLEKLFNEYPAAEPKR